MASARPGSPQPHAHRLLPAHQLSRVHPEADDGGDHRSVFFSSGSTRASNVINLRVSAAGSSRGSSPVRARPDPDASNLKSMPKGLSASLPDLDSESWIEVKKRPRPSPARPKVSSEHHVLLQSEPNLHHIQSGVQESALMTRLPSCLPVTDAGPFGAAAEGERRLCSIPGSSAQHLALPHYLRKQGEPLTCTVL